MKDLLAVLFTLVTLTGFSQTNPTGLDNTVNTNEDIDRIITAADFGYNDADGDPFTQIQIFSTVSVGTLFLDIDDDNIVDGGEPVAANDIISIGDISLNRLKFRPIANAYGASYDNFRFYVNDGNDGNSVLNYLMDINVNAVNDDPTITTNTGSTLNEDAVHTISQAELETTDVEQGANNLTYTINAIPANGTLHNGGGPALIVGNTFTQNDINTSNITYDHNGGETTTDAFTFTVTDGAGGTTLATVFNITINPVNDVPTLVANTGITVNEASSANIISNANLQVTDVDNTTAQIIYTLNVAPGNGTLYNGAAPLGVGNTFTQNNIDLNTINYTHDGTETNNDSFTFTVADGSGGNIGATVFNITVTPQNDNPVLVTNTGKTVNEGATNQTILTAELQTTDADNTPVQLTYTLTAVPTNGTLDIGGPALGIGGTFTQNDINSNLLQYDHDGSETIADAFTFTIADGAGGNIGATTFNLTITPQNDNPVLAVNTGKTVNEGATTQIIPNTELQVTDVDNTNVQITYTLTVAPTNGTLYNGVAPLIAGNTFTQNDINSNSINYTHDGTETISDAFTFTVADGSGGAIGATVFNITITPQNDNPVLANNTGKTVNEGAANQTILTAELQVTDVDNTPAQLTYTLTVAPTNGTLDIGGPALGVGGTFTQNDINSNLLEYTHDGSETTTDAFTFTIADGAGGTIGPSTFNLTITPQNDNPVLTLNTGKTVNEAATAQIIPNTELQVTDADNTAAQIIYTITAATINGTLYNGAAPLGVGNTFTQKQY
jgi:VCBS repeat-containing protein